MKKKPKTVKPLKAYIFAVAMSVENPCIWDYQLTMADARSSRANMKRSGWLVGPIVRIEVPAPVKARKAGGK